MRLRVRVAGAGAVAVGVRMKILKFVGAGAVFGAANLLVRY